MGLTVRLARYAINELNHNSNYVAEQHDTCRNVSFRKFAWHTRTMYIIKIKFIWNIHTRQKN